MKSLPNALAILGTTAKLTAADDIMGIRPSRELGFWAEHWPWAAPLIAVVLVILGVLVYLLIRKKGPPPLSAYEHARRELKRLEAEEGQMDDKAYSIGLSAALRRYLEGAFGLRAPEQTTEEFLEVAQADERIGGEALNTLQSFLELCDLAKFARHAFGQDERRQLLTTATEFIEQAERKEQANKDSI